MKSVKENFVYIYFGDDLVWLLVTLTAVSLGLGSNPRKRVDICKCIVPLRYQDTLNRHRAASLLASCELQGVENGSPQRENSVHCTDIFDVKDVPRTGRPVVESVDKISEVIVVDWYFRSRSIAQELKIARKTVLNNLWKVRIKKKLDVWLPHQLTPKNMMDRISICEALAKRNEIDPFLKRMMAEGEKWVTYDNNV
ncbi:histone-lysine N-methyltransferase SETMAR [Trichonephila clavipes]|nr:histone-lysine N-methyltransferase SETMAR [Trichonephila clavipes]